MEAVLKLKSWQVFLGILAFPTAINLLLFFDIDLFLRMFPLGIFWLLGGLMIWLWAIVTTLQKKMPHRLKINLVFFKVLFLVPIIYFLFLLYLSIQSAFSETTIFESIEGQITLLQSHLVSLAFIAVTMGFAAWTIKSLETRSDAGFRDCAPEFIQFWMFPVGIWTLQPRVNKLSTIADS